MATTTQPPQTVFEQTRWRLDDLFPGPDSPDLLASFEKLDTMVAEFETMRDYLTPDISTGAFLNIISRYEAITHELYRLYGFAGLWFSEDTQNQAALSLQARVEQTAATLTNRTLFFNLWWKGLEDEDADRLQEEAGEYRYWLEKMRHFKPHTLTEAEEKIINIKDVTGASAINTLYDAITNRYVFKIEVDGEIKEMTRGELMVLARHADPEQRAATYQELYRVYGKDAPILGQMYQTLVRDWRNEQVDLRHFETPIAVRNLSNDIPDDIVDTLLDVARDNSGIFQRFFKLKARWIGVERLRRYDIYAPVTASDKTYSFAEAEAMVFDAFNEFSPGIADMARTVFLDHHVDSEVRKGKRGGAFCWSVAPELSPWVMLNYQGRANDVSTMAHELGHAIHDILARDHPMLTYHPTLPLAETASTFAEMLLVDRMLAEEQDESVRRDILFTQMDDNYATIMRQVYFALFERTAHDMIQQNASVDELSDAYMANLSEQFGDAVDLSDELRHEWVSIPHIYHVPFYVYAYAFGQLLVLALYQQFKAEGEPFKSRYMGILAAGGSAAPVDILAQAGIDIHQRSFWQGGFDILNNWVDQLQAIPIPSADE